MRVSQKFRTGLIAASVAVLCGGGPAQAAFMPVIDEFWIVRNSTEIFRDSFDNGIPPHLETIGPNPTYNTSGEAGFVDENGGVPPNERLTMNPSLGSGVLIPGLSADLFTGATRRTSITGGGNELNQAASFEVHGLFDLSSLPEALGDNMGIRFIDRVGGTGPLAQEGDDVLQLSVSYSAGNAIIRLAHLDFDSDTIETLDVASFLTVSGLTPTQIELVLTNGSGTNLVGAEFTVFDQNGDVMQTGSLSATSGSTDVTIFNGEDFTRGQFFSTTTVDVPPIPEPEMLIVFATGLAGLALRRRVKG